MTKRTGSTALLAMLAASTLSLAAPALAEDSADDTLLDQGFCTADGSKSNDFLKFFDLRPGQEALHLSLNLHNGTKKSPGFEKLRITLPGCGTKTEKDLDKDGKLTIDLTGKVTWGPSEFLVSGVGPKGALLSWNLSALTPKFTSMEPSTALPGDVITVHGKNLVPTQNGNAIGFATFIIQISDVTKDSLKFTIPSEVPPGTFPIRLVSGMLEAGTQQITVKSFPLVLSVSTGVLKSKSEFSITGKNFSKTADQNDVKIGSHKCEIKSADEGTLVCVTPDLTGDDALALPLTVSTNGVPARAKLSLQRTLE